MGSIFEKVHRAVLEERYLFSDHADNQLRERGIVHWQVVTGLEQGRPLVERPGAQPNPVVEVDQILADGTPIKAVWAHVAGFGPGLDFAKLVTVHFYGR